ncbi:hypothetical protein [Eleftheria terrae]|uniref:hypothetical protein n=1 Tax=Eleftheria terrae TaxID=1597781 RepID=UPI00263B7ADE|nr:hypothetical protein [Eleftheria terrae]WKB54810.1 hypothetical protein N7L95_10685 [Eleftheria terrae]
MSRTAATPTPAGWRRQARPPRLSATWAVAALLALHAAGPAAAAPAGAAQLVHATAAGLPVLGEPAGEAGDYLALACDDQGCALERSTVAVVKSPALRDAEGEDLGPGYRVLLKHPKPVLALLRGLPGLQEGPLPTWHLNRRFLRSTSSFVDSGKRLFKGSVKVPGQPLLLQGHWDKPGHQPGAAPEQLRWEVTHGGYATTVSTVAVGGLFGAEGIPGAQDYLLWVGDLDRDGRPDLLVRPQEGAEGSLLQLDLHLGRDRQPGKAWKPAASYFWAAPEGIN